MILYAEIHGFVRSQRNLEGADLVALEEDEAIPKDGLVYRFTDDEKRTLALSFESLSNELSAYELVYIDPSIEHLWETR